MHRQTVEVRSLTRDEWTLCRELRLEALAEAPDAFGSTLAAESRKTDDEWQSRLSSGLSSGFDLPLVALQEGEGVGLAWVKRAASGASTATLYQMWVAPDSRGHGVGSNLLAAAICWVRQLGLQHLVLGATCGDTAAMRLYVKYGFQCIGEPEPLRPGSRLLSQAMVLQLNAPAA